jgi:Yip1 domain
MDLVGRAKAILLRPKQEWPAIENEATTPVLLYTSYIVPLAAIGPIARAIGLSVFGLPLGFLGTYRVSPVRAAAGAIVSFVFTLAGVWVLAWIIDWLAPKFGGQSNSIQALKVAAYSSTAAWLAGIFGLIPLLSILGLFGLYSLYLLYLGLPVLMKSPPDRSLTYTVVVILAGIAIAFLVTVLVAIVSPYGRPGIQM